MLQCAYYLMSEKKNAEKIMGSVTEALPNTLFRVQTEKGENILAFLSGKMRLNRIRVLIGDKVEMEVDPYGGKARIVRRY